MTITLSSELDRFLEEEVASGRYTSVAEAISDAVERLRRERSAEDLTAKLRQGVRDLEEGRYREIRTPEDSLDLRASILQKASCPAAPTEGT